MKTKLHLRNSLTGRCNYYNPSRTFMLQEVSKAPTTRVLYISLETDFRQLEELVKNTVLLSRGEAV